ncbi:MAG: methyltransferase domain-containing protein [Herminiimonas sp.]|nr:methyltransferase domain-containing protein [Herminiimonas sp.]
MPAPIQPDFPADAPMSAPIDLSRVRRLFAHPPRVIESDFLRREVAMRMHERLALVRLTPDHVLDAGCGTGADLPALQKHYPQSRVIGVDGAHAMLQAALVRQHAALSSMNRLLSQLLPRQVTAARGLHAGLACSDFARLPFGLGSFDLVWSNLALHWHPQPDRVFAEWRRILRVDGLLMFSCFGPDTFKQLRTAFAGNTARSGDVDRRLLPFVDMHDFGDMLIQAGFSTPVMDMETITVTYESVERLLADVRAWGGNALTSRPRGLLGRQAHGHFTDRLEAMRSDDGRIPLTFEVIYGHAFRPVSRTTASGESIIRIDTRRK